MVSGTTSVEQERFLFRTLSTLISSVEVVESQSVSGTSAATVSSEDELLGSFVFRPDEKKESVEVSFVLIRDSGGKGLARMLVKKVATMK